MVVTRPFGGFSIGSIPVSPTKFLIYMIKYDYDAENIQKIVAESLNFSEVLRKLNIPKRGNNLKTIKNFIIKNNIEYSHFTYEKRYNQSNRSKSIDDYLNNKVQITSYKLKRKLLKEKLLEYKCSCCGISEWNGKHIELQLHHIDGNPFNNNLKNLQLLCPNCHSQTDNFSNKKEIKKERYKLCPKCGKKIHITSTYCSKCAAEYKKTTKLQALTKEKLLEKFLELKAFTKVGKYYNVSDNAIKKKCLKLGLPTTKQEMNDLIVNMQNK